MNKADLLLEAARRGLLTEKNLSVLKEGKLQGVERDDKIANAIEAISNHAATNSAEMADLVRMMAKALQAFQAQKPPQVNVTPNIRMDAPKEPTVNVEAVIQPADVKVTVQKHRIKRLVIERDQFGQMIGLIPEYE